MQRIELASELRDLDVDIIPLNFLNPIPGTRLEKRLPLSPVEALKTTSLFRFINPDKDISAAGGREITFKDFQSWIIPAGANRIMIGNYLTTKGRDIYTDLDMIEELRRV